MNTFQQGKVDDAQGRLEKMTQEQWFIERYGAEVDLQFDGERDTRDDDEYHVYMDIITTTNTDAARATSEEIDKDYAAYAAPFIEWCKRNDYSEEWAEIQVAEDFTSITYRITIYL